MIKGKIIPFPSNHPFSPEAKKRWNQIHKSMQEKILNNVWCGYCSGSSTIILESAKMDRSDLILRGKCKVCGHEVCRLVEPA